MPYREQKLVNNEIYHITLKRIGEKLLFKDIDDHYRGIFSIYEFNNTNPVTIRERRRERAKFKKAVKEGKESSIPDYSRDLLVEVLVFCLSPNAYSYSSTLKAA